MTEYICVLLRSLSIFFSFLFLSSHTLAVAESLSFPNNNDWAGSNAKCETLLFLPFVYLSGDINYPENFGVANAKGALPLDCRPQERVDGEHLRYRQSGSTFSFRPKSGNIDISIENPNNGSRRIVSLDGLVFNKYTAKLVDPLSIYAYYFAFYTVLSVLIGSVMLIKGRGTKTAKLILILPFVITAQIIWEYGISASFDLSGDVWNFSISAVGSAAVFVMLLYLFSRFIDDDSKM